MSIQSSTGDQRDGVPPLSAADRIAQTEAAGGTSANDERNPLPRPDRRKNRAKADRGLPPDRELVNLARAYLERQRMHWPNFIEAGLLPDATDVILHQMVDDFKDRHRGGTIDIAAVGSIHKLCAKLGGSYNRYSCDNSSPTSALDQMVKSLDKAHSEERFIPWQYVYADYSVTGLDSGRQGYTSYKAVLADKRHLIETTYIDDFTRASRDELEWWKLAAFSKQYNKRMIGASDGFDLSAPTWDLWLTIYGLLSRLFIKGLREKVRRGMHGAARRGTSLGRLSFGFTRAVHRDDHGREIRDRNGLPVYEPCIDPATSRFLRLIFELYVEKNWPANRIARYFNQLKVEDWDGWTQHTINRLLRNPSAIGVFIWNKNRSEYDWESGKMILVPNPRKEWHVRYDRKLAIVSLDLWRAGRRKLALVRRTSPKTGKKPSRNQRSATTLFSGTLFCSYCGAELKLVRSTDKAKQLGCYRGLTLRPECKLSVSKSTRLIENCLLNHLRDVLLTETQIEVLTARANRELERQTQLPQVDTSGWKEEIRKLRTRIKRLVSLIEDEPDESLCPAHHARIKELQSQLNLLMSQVHEAEKPARTPYEPLTDSKAQEYLARFRELLNQDIPAAAEAIRALTGPIQIRQERVPWRKNGGRWVPTFNPDLYRALAYATRGGGENSDGLRVEGTFPAESVEVPIDQVPKYVRLAETFHSLHKAGASIYSIASQHQMSVKYVRKALALVGASGDVARDGAAESDELQHDTVQGGAGAKATFILKEVR